VQKPVSECYIIEQLIRTIVQLAYFLGILHTTCVVNKEFVETGQNLH